MRLSVRKNDPGYSRHSYRAKVFVDGKQIHNCFTADEEIGEAFCHAVDSDGKVFLAEDGISLATIVLKGKVQIVFTKGEN